MELRIDTRIESYDNFVFSHEHEALVNKAGNTLLEDPVLRLVSSWDAASTARAYPILIASSIETTAARGAQVILADHGAAFNMVLAKLAKHLDSCGEPLNYTQKKKLRLALRDIMQRTEKEFNSPAAERFRDSLKKGALWSNFIKNEAAINSLFHSQQIAILHVYSAYETFLNRVFKICRIVGKEKIVKKLEMLSATLGEDLKPLLWSEDVQFVSKLRHCITHNGGLVTDDVRNLPSKYLIKLLKDDTVVIEPAKVNLAYGTLFLAVKTFVSRHVMKPVFSKQ